MLQNWRNKSMLVLKYMYSEIFQIPVGTVTPLGAPLFLATFPPKLMADILDSTATPSCGDLWNYKLLWYARAHYRKRCVSRGMR